MVESKQLWNNRESHSEVWMCGVLIQQWPSTQITLFERTREGAWLNAVTTPVDKTRVNPWVNKGSPQNSGKCSLRRATNITFSKFRGWRRQKKLRCACLCETVLCAVLINSLINNWFGAKDSEKLFASLAPDKCEELYSRSSSWSRVHSNLTEKRFFDELNNPIHSAWSWRSFEKTKSLTHRCVHIGCQLNSDRAFRLICLKGHIRARDSTLWRHQLTKANEFLCISWQEASEFLHIFLFEGVQQQKKSQKNHWILFSMR